MFLISQQHIGRVIKPFIRLTLFCLVLTMLNGATFALTPDAKELFNTIYKKWHAANPSTSSTQDYVDTYMLGPEDVVTISIPDFYMSDSNSSVRTTVKQPITINGDYRIGNSGELTIPVLGTYNVNKMTLTQVREMVTEMSAYYLKNPVVTVSLKGHRSFSVYILGDVKKPGVYQVAPSTTTINYNIAGAQGANIISPGDFENFASTISAVIKKAGGIEQYADIRNVTLENKETGKYRVIDLHKLIAEGDASQDVRVEPDDVIRIGHSVDSILADRGVSLSNLAPNQYYIRMVGYVNKSFTSGQVQLSPDRMTLLDAMGLVSFNSDVDTRHVVVLRKVPQQDSFEKFELNPYKKNFPLEPGDTVVFTGIHTISRIKDITQVMSQLLLPTTLLLK